MRSARLRITIRALFVCPQQKNKQHNQTHRKREHAA